MSTGFKAGFMTATGVLVAYYLYQIVSFLVTNLVIQPLLKVLLG